MEESCVSIGQVAGSFRCGGGIGMDTYGNMRWCAEQWPKSWLESGIVWDLIFLEAFFLILVADFWNKSFNFWCDNKALVHIINSQ